MPSEIDDQQRGTTPENRGLAKPEDQVSGSSVAVEDERSTSNRGIEMASAFPTDTDAKGLSTVSTLPVVASEVSRTSPPEIHEHSTSLGGLMVGNFDLHFAGCEILVWVWLKFQFSSDITSAEQTAFRKRFLDAVNGRWENTGWHLLGSKDCPCPVVPIRIHAEETAKGFYHKLVDVEKKSDEERRPKVIRDINVNLLTSDITLGHEFGHVLGLYDEYDGGFFENIMFWHRNQPGDTSAVMSNGTELRPRYFEEFRKRVQEGAKPPSCKYSISSPLPPGSAPGTYPLPDKESVAA